MMPMLSSVWALGALAAIPALVAIYLFQRRFRTREVSSLLLWDAIQQASMGGRTREPLRLPLAFWLELAAIALIALAAAGPILPRWSRTRPLVIVLDDSLSMSAGGDDAPRAKAMKFVRDSASRGGHDPVHVVFAGATPQLAGGATFAEKLRGWTCNAATGDLDAAIGFATQVGGPSALVLVVTDRAPESELEKGSLTWRAFGTSRANVAFAVAARGSERVLLEIASHAKTDQTRTLTLSDGKSLPVALRPGERKRLQFSASGAKPFEARLSGDDAPFDDRVVLLPEARPPVRVALRIAHPEMRADVEQALRASGRVALTDVRPEVIVTDGAPPGAESNGGWSVVLRTSKATRAVTGPYVLDRTHPLLRGLSLEGLIWGVPAELNAQSPSNALVLVGNETLLSDERVSGGHRIRLRLDPSISNVQRAPVWPAFWWNVLEWRTANAPGVRVSNVSLGSDARVRVEGPRAIVIAPDGTRREMEPADGEIVIEATQRGIWQVDRHRFAVNALVPSESDLMRATNGTWGGWSEESLLSSGYQDVAWLALLLALVVLAWHHVSLWRTVPAAGSAS
jgi:aerotolerance regulator-like protein